MSKAKSVERSERPLAKGVVAKLNQIGEPTRSIYAERLRELKPNAREALQLLSGWEGKRAELALTRPLSERERSNPKTLEAKAAALTRQAYGHHRPATEAEIVNGRGKAKAEDSAGNS